MARKSSFWFRLALILSLILLVALCWRQYRIHKSAQERYAVSAPVAGSTTDTAAGETDTLVSHRAPEKNAGRPQTASGTGRSERRSAPGEEAGGHPGAPVGQPPDDSGAPPGQSTEFLEQDLSGIRYLEEPLSPTQKGQKIYHMAYTVSYRPDWCQSEWVAYQLLPEELVRRVPRPNRFSPDPKARGPVVRHTDYTNTGYDRGHLAPAADMTWDVTAMRQSFYLSNVSPQLHGFNAGIWLRLEGKVRSLALRHDSIFVVTGPLFWDRPVSRVGKLQIPVPSHFYKVLLAWDGSRWQGIAFCIPNQEGLRDYWRYARSIATLQEETGIDFFPLLPDSVEVVVERELHLNFWR